MKKNILIIEDDHIIANGLMYALTDENYAVDWHEHGIKGLEAANKNNYHLISLDLNLPGMHGIDILKHIRKNKQQIPIICMTSEDTYENKTACLDNGADIFLAKPFDLDDYLSHVKKLTND